MKGLTVLHFFLPQNQNCGLQKKECEKLTPYFWSFRWKYESLSAYYAPAYCHRISQCTFNTKNLDALSRVKSQKECFSKYKKGTTAGKTRAAIEITRHWKPSNHLAFCTWVVVSQEQKVGTRGASKTLAYVWRFKRIKALRNSGKLFKYSCL